MRNHSLLSLPLAALLAAALCAGAEETFTGVERVVAMGDIHGDYAALAGLLRAAGLTDSSGKWAGGKAHLVQLGDVLDRGADVRRCLDLLIALQKEARRGGGAVHALIGNHEAMNLYGDLRYVHPGDYASFRNENSERVRDMYYQRHTKELKRNPPPAGLPELDDNYQRKWFASHPLGFFEHLTAFAPDAPYGKWIVSNPAAVKINNMVFFHGGIAPKYAGLSLKDINKKIASELAEPGRLEGSMAIDPEGPLWYRGLAQEEESALQTHVKDVLERLGAAYMVVGHTVTRGFVTPRFNGAVLLLDTGISRTYGSHPACLLVEKGRQYAIHRGTKLELPKNMGTDLLRYRNEVAQIDRAAR